LDHVVITDEGALRRICMNRPDKKNAITSDMYEEMGRALEEADAQSDIRAVVLQGEGQDFTAGNDMGDFMAANASSEGADDFADTAFGKFLGPLARFRKPLVAGVEGSAVGVGFTMLLHCDLVFVGENAKLRAPFVNLALVPEAASSYLLPQMVGHRKAFEIFALGTTISAHEAVRLGLANAAVSKGLAVEAANKAARELCQRPPEALALTKRLMKPSIEHVETIMREEGAHFGERLASDELREAVSAFIEKREPRFAA
jgi:enoyl-CoA hydratase/carnithine racemase